MKRKKDGTLDMRYKANKEYVSRTGDRNGDYVGGFSSSNGGFSTSKGGFSSRAPPTIPSMNTTSFGTAYSRPYNNTPNYGNTNILFTKDGNIDKRCSAVRNGSIKFNQDGSIDKRSSAYRQGLIQVNSEGYAYSENTTTTPSPPKFSFNKPSNSNSFNTNATNAAPKFSFKKSSNTSAVTLNPTTTSSTFKFKKDGTIDKRCKAVRDGDVFFKEDGSIDQRSKAVKNGSILLKNDGTVDQRCNVFLQEKKVEQSPNHYPFLNESFYEAQNKLFTDNEIQLNYDGTINMSSPAIQDGSILIKSDGTVDKRCSAYKQKKIILDNFDKIDYRSMNLKLPSYPKEQLQFQFLKQKDPFESVEPYIPSKSYIGNIEEREIQFPIKNEFDDYEESIQEPVQIKKLPELKQKPLKTLPELKPKKKSVEEKKSDNDIINVEKNENKKKKSIEKNDKKVSTTTQTSYKNQQKIKKTLPDKSKANVLIDITPKNDDDEDEEENINSKKMKINKNEEKNKKYQTRSVKSMNTKFENKEKEKEDDIYNIYSNQNYEKNKKYQTRSVKSMNIKNKENDQNDKTINTNIIYMILIIILFISYFVILSFLPLKNERTFLSKCPKQAFCDVTVEGNKTKLTINRCEDNYIKLENGFIQLCSPKNHPRLEEYLDTLKAASFISKNDGNCLLKHKKIDVFNIMEFFPKVDIELLQSDDDFLTEYVDGEFRSIAPQYNLMCRIYTNSVHTMPIQTTLIIIICISAILITYKNYLNEN